MSLAKPSTLKQSARFGVRSTSMTQSSKSRYSRKSIPTGASVGSSIKPSVSGDRPNSCAAHNIPCEGTPRSLAFLILKPPGSTAPTKAVGAFIPARTFFAPHTICTGSSSPTSTWVTFNLSASGCFSTLITKPTTTLLKGGATGSMPSTSSPARLNSSAKVSVSHSGFTQVLNHFSLTFICLAAYLNCLRNRKSFSKNCRKSFTP